MANITRMNVMITANSKGLITGLSRSEMAIRGFSKRVNQSMRMSFMAISGYATKLGTALSGPVTSGLRSMQLGALAAGAALSYLTAKSIAAVGDANDLSKALGISYNGLRRIQFAAGQAGVEAGAVNASLMKMSDTLGTAFQGDKTAIEYFERIGLSINQLAKMNPEQQFIAIAQAIDKIKDPSQKIAAARDIFGRGGGALISFFGNAGEAIAQADQAIQHFGIALSQIDVEKIDAAGDAIGKLATFAEGLGNQLARILSPYIKQVTEDLSNWVAEMGGVGPAVDAGFQYAIEAIDAMLSRIEEIELAWMKAKKAVNDFYLSIYEQDPDSELTKKQDQLITDRRLAGIPEHRREQARALLEERGGFESESPNVAAYKERRRMDEEYNARIDEIAARKQQRGTLGERFSKWRQGADQAANAEAAASLGMTPMAPPVTYKKHVPNGYMDKIPSGENSWQSRIPTGTPGYMSHKPKQTEDTNLLRQIAANTAKNTIGFAGN